MRTLRSSLTLYRARHRTPGCKITHLIGVPLLVMVPFSLIFARKHTTLFFWGGLFMQLAGHFVFEKNEPTLMETHDPMMVPASLIFVAEEWRDVLTGKWVQKNGLNLWAKTPLVINPSDDHLFLPDDSA